MTDLAVQRKELISTSMNQIKSIIKFKGVNRDALEEVKNIVTSMTGEAEMFGDSAFPTPTPEEIAKIYLLSDEDDGDFSLYLISVLPVGPSPIHDHGTFAVIAGLDGDEENTIYKRLDDGSEDGKASLEVDYKVTLKSGDAIAFMPEDIHRICVVSEKPTRHFHLYGKGFEQQTNRLEFNIKEGTTKSASGSFIPVDESRRVI
ncbi:MAG: cysteine dioxygenase family protein [Gammaproteobacteria bacterium]|jgi:predicted metal-dependent enzyme (double-stranded beta helix superfamily)|nr:cysteine dioxygenase family protein [Gammaproteobacteria bacterium]MBT5155595.1 cysteine dioxygenase family protein [Gammaproteobacteria bacterium]MBT5684634.1 cysteine dioxygenase family protein [Gammaproteobacteria bacterium]MBT5725807.1 cysteine dioxygenase family protein [Gammaproteobacteria bacterium]MBT6586650.1 cysteine dioxygenase family protein [Gammaproteobacteria bacterium]